MTDEIKGEFYSERFVEPKQGFAVTMQQSNEEVIKLAVYLSERGIQTMITPGSTSFVPTIRILQDDKEPQLAVPGNVILVTGPGRAEVYTWYGFERKFLRGAIQFKQYDGPAPITQLPEWEDWLEEQRNAPLANKENN